ncbi:MAG: biotin--[acetyl-CoA-carboxylase] ligase [Dehalococcoidia bacterium]|nr:biotin--[acetyl-CoA-carboxylase] ligase [Dehalococcoidia bacterium]
MPPDAIIGRRVVLLSTVTSTMDVAQQEAAAGAPDGTVVVAEEQTEGRGRFGRAWRAPFGSSLLMTALLRPTLEALPALSIWAAEGVARGVDHTLAALGVPAHPVALKWPNDLLLDGKKFGGVLIETRVLGEETVAFLGVGVNVNFDPATAPGVPADATSLALAVGGPVDRSALLAHILRCLDATYRSLADPDGRARVVAAWRARLVTLGRSVTVRMGDREFVGVAEDVDATGALFLRLADGHRLTVTAGEVTLRQ